MNISIFGLGYVGAVSAACLAKTGHTVIGVDTEQTKVDMINQGKTPIIEEKIAELIDETVQAKKLRATKNTSEALMSLSLIHI